MLRTATAIRLNKLINVFFSVVIGDLFPRFNVLDRKNKNSLFVDRGFCIWPAGVIDVSGFVPLWFAVYGVSFSYFKEVPALAGLLFFG